MFSVLRKLVRLGGPISARLLKFLYTVFDGFYRREEYCEICGFPIARDQKLNTLWADAEVLNLVNKPYYLYPICKHCRDTRPWEDIYKAYSSHYSELFRKTDKLGFVWPDVREALERDRRENLSKGEIKEWKKTLKAAYKAALPGCSEFCGFKKGKELPELIIAAEELGEKHGILVVNSENRTSIKINKKNGKRKKEEKQRVIILPGPNKN